MCYLIDAVQDYRTSGRDHLLGPLVYIIYIIGHNIFI